MFAITWRELADAIEKMPNDVQQLDACIWLPFDFDSPGTEFPNVIGVCAYDGELPISVDNPPSLNIEEG